MFPKDYSTELLVGSDPANISRSWLSLFVKAKVHLLAFRFAVREALFAILQGLILPDPKRTYTSAMIEFAAVYKLKQLKTAKEEVVRKAAAHSLARQGLVKAEALDLYRLLLPEGVQKTARTFLRPLEQLQQGKFLELKKRWALLALVLPCSAVDLVCSLFQKAEKYRSEAGVEFPSSEMHLYKAVLAELAGDTAGVVIDVPDGGSATLSIGDFSDVGSSDASSTPSYVSKAIETASKTFARQSVRTLRMGTRFDATVALIESFESYLSGKASGPGTITSTSGQTSSGQIDLDGYTITPSALGTASERPEM
jgi:hypothetical protein